MFILLSASGPGFGFDSRAEALQTIVLNKVFNQLSVGVFLSQHVISVLCESGMDCVSCLTNILKATLFTNNDTHNVWI